MEQMERRYSVLLISSVEKLNQLMISMLPGSRFAPISVVSDVASANRLLLEQSFDIVIINAPLPDDMGTRLAIDISNQSAAGVMLLVKSEHYPEVEARLSPFGIFTISKPTSTQFLLQAAWLLCATRERLRRMEKKTASVQEKMEEIRLVNRAKWLLIEQLKMSETEAHHYIERLAMNRCTSKRAVAENIIATYR